MSTRSQLRFVERVDQDGEPNDDGRVAQVYRHSDGYPESVLRELAQLKELLKATRAERGSGYTAASFVFLDKLSTIDLYLDGDPDRTVDAAEPADLLKPVNRSILTSHCSCSATASKTRRTASAVAGSTSVAEWPEWNLFRGLTESTIKVSGHSTFSGGMA